MDFKLQVLFEYNIKKGSICQKGQFSNVFQLRDIVQNYLNYDSFELILTKKVLADNYVQNQKTTVLNEKINIIVMDKLIYPVDVRKFLEYKYNNTFNFNELNLKQDKPVYFSGVMEREELGPINPNTGDKTTYTRRYVDCRELTDSDIVVDKLLFKILPMGQRSLSYHLVNFLDKEINIH